MLISIILLIGMIMGYILCEAYHLMVSEKSLNEFSKSKNSKRFNTIFVYLSVWGISFIVFSMLFHIDLYLDYWIVFILFLYLFSSDYFIYDNKIKVKFTKKQMTLVVIIACSLLLIIFLAVGLFGSFYAGSIFSGADWFTSTFITLVKAPNVIAIVSLMTIGGFTTIIGIARHSLAYKTLGFFLIISLPIFSIFDTFLNSIDTIKETASAIYNAFQSEGLTVFIYTIIMTMFYMLLTSIIIGMSSLANSIGSDD